MPNKKTIIHLGLQKTASTFLQERFFPKLSNVLYIGRPFTQENQSFNKLQYADHALFDKAVFNSELAKLQASCPEQGTLLISDELFSGYALYNFINRGMIAERLAEAAPDAEVLLIVRNQKDLIISMYNQYIKTGLLDRKLDRQVLATPGQGYSLEEWLAGKRHWNEDNRYINSRYTFNVEHFRYSNLLALYKRYFNTVHVLLYEDFIADQETFLSNLCRLLGCTPPTMEPHANNDKTQINTRLQQNDLKAKLFKNKLSHISSIMDGPVGSTLGKCAAFLTADTQLEQEQYVKDVLIEYLIDKDNQEVENLDTPGFSHYADKYYRFE